MQSYFFMIYRQDRSSVLFRSIFVKLAVLSAAVTLLLASSMSVQGQGCILARSPEQGGLPTGEGGVLQPGHFQITIGERHQFSYQHYVGDGYQEYRAPRRTP